jgi:hypothetical protein
LLVHYQGTGLNQAMRLEQITQFGFSGRTRQIADQEFHAITMLVFDNTYYTFYRPRLHGELNQQPDQRRSIPDEP